MKSIKLIIILVIILISKFDDTTSFKKTSRIKKKAPGTPCNQIWKNQIPGSQSHFIKTCEDAKVSCPKYCNWIKNLYYSYAFNVFICKCFMDMGISKDGRPPWKLVHITKEKHDLLSSSISRSILYA